MDAQQLKGARMVQEEHGWVEHVAMLCGSIGVLGASAAGLLKWWRPKGATSKKVVREYIEGIESIHALQTEMTNAVNDGYCDRSILMFGHNCGGLPSAAEQYYISALHWQGTNCGHLKDLQKIKVDPIFCSMILDLLRNNRVDLVTEEMQPGILKEIYLSEKVTEAKVFLLGVRDNKLFYISFSRIECGFRPGDALRLELTAQRISQIIMR